MQVFDEQGNVVEGEGVVNDLTKSPVFQQLPAGLTYIPIVIPAADGATPRLGLVVPSVIATAAQVSDVKAKADKAEQDAAAAKTQAGQADSKASTAVATASAAGAKADGIVVPQAATAAPPGVAVDGSKGDIPRYALENHTHPARVQRKEVTLDVNGMATWTFTKPFDSKPVVNYMVEQATGEPIIIEVNAFVMTNGKWSGVTVKGYRSRVTPTVAPLNVLAILGAVVTGVNTLISALSNFNLFAGGNLTGVKVHLSAGDAM